MPIKQNNKIYPWIYHGGAIDLSTLSKQDIKVTIRFPYTENNGKWDLQPLTVNLLTDIGISPNSRVYAVDWGDNSRLTMNNGMIPYKHKHTYSPGSGNSSYTIDFNISIYGDDLLTYRGYEKHVGTAPSGYDIKCTLVDEVVPAKLFRAFTPTDKDYMLKPGSRINRAFWGKYLVYGKTIQGSEWSFDIVLNGNNTVRLYNPLIRMMNDWENKRTDMIIDWGDGETTYFYNRKINTGLFNNSSSYIPEHTYKETAGNRFIIKIQGVEPVFPTKCKVLAIDGSLPEDYYCGNPAGLLTYGDNWNNEYRTLLSDIKHDIVSVSSSLLDNWLPTKSMSQMFSYWSSLEKVPQAFFKSNILDNCTNYHYCFGQCYKLREVDRYILGETNNIVINTQYMFTKAVVDRTIELRSSNSLQIVDGMYFDTLVETAENFLVDVPNLYSARYLFNITRLHNYTSDLLKNSPKMRIADYIMDNTWIEEIRIDMTQWSYIENLAQGFRYNPHLKTIQNGIFGGDFGKNSPANSIHMNNIFQGIGSATNYVDIKAGVFSDLANITDKLFESQNNWFTNSYINKLLDGWFDNVFKGNPRFTLRDFFKNVKTTDNFGYDIKCIYIPNMFRNSPGIIDIQGMFCQDNIGYIEKDAIAEMPNLNSVDYLFGECYLHCRFPEKFFYNNKKIQRWINLFVNATFKYPDIPIDDIIWTEGVDSVDVSCMLAARDQKLKCYRLFGYSSDVKDVNVVHPTSGTDAFFTFPTGSIMDVPFDYIVRNRTYTTNDTRLTTVEPDDLIYRFVVMNDNVTITLDNTTASGTISLDGGNYVSVTFPYTLTVNTGNHELKIRCSEAVRLVVDDNNVQVTMIDGQFPYNSNPGRNYHSNREFGRMVYAICNPEAVHNEFTHVNVPILHKDQFKYHETITKTLFSVVAPFQDNENMYPYTFPGVYDLQPRIYEHMRNLSNFDHIFENYHRVISDITLPEELNASSVDLSNIYGTVEDCYWDINTKTFIQPNAFTRNNYTINNLNLGRIQPVYENTSYIEMRLRGSKTAITLRALSGQPSFPITVETYFKDQINASTHVLNDLSTSIPVKDDCFVRIYANTPVWINETDMITELFGTVPRCDFTWKMLDLCPNLKRISENFFVFCTNESFKGTFKGLQEFEYFPGTLFWYNYNAVDYEECFAECPKLFKVDDYIITDKKGDINCKNMFRNSGVTNVRHPIMDDINGKVDITGMFTGCKTAFFYENRTNLDKIIFRNIDIYGKSGIAFSGTNSQTNSEYYCCLDVTNAELMKISYCVNVRLFNRTDNVDLNSSLKYASQAIREQAFRINSTLLNNTSLVDHCTDYLPFIKVMLPWTINSNKPYPENYFRYMERLKYPGMIALQTAGTFPDLMFIRNNNIISLAKSFMNSKITGNTINDFFPVDCNSLITTRDMFNGATGVTNNDWKIPTHIIRDTRNMFANSNIDPQYGFFDNVNLNHDSITEYRDNPDNSVLITETFINNTGIDDEVGIFKAYNKYLHPEKTTGVYNNSSLNNFIDQDDVFTGCEHLEVLDYNFVDCSDLGELPKINHLTNVWSYQHMFERCNILDIPEYYVYTTRDDRDIMLDYMFANNPELFFTYVWIDPRCPGYFSIDYSLNEVFSGIGDDPEIFGHIRYDEEYEHRSRVYPFDTRVTWTQVIETFTPNVSVKLRGLYNEDLVGFDPEKIYAVTWGDTKAVTVVRDGFTLEESHISHTYAEPGRYEISVMLRNDCCYLETPYANKDNIVTVGLPTSFKYGKVSDIANKGLHNMFGRHVEYVNNELFNNLEGVDTITSYQNMFYYFTRLSLLPAGILDCMPNLINIDNFLHSSRDYTGPDIRLTLEKGLFDKNTKLQSLVGLCHVSNVDVVEEGLFDNNTEVVTIAAIFTGTKLTELPRRLLYNLTKLTNASYFLWYSTNFILDESYDDFFINNPLITDTTEAFSAVKIHVLPPNLMKPLVNLTNAHTMFGTYEDSKQPWDEAWTMSDDNDWTIPEGFLSANTKLVNISTMFCGRKSLKSYPADILDYCRGTLTDAHGMFEYTGISQIHEGTFDGHTTNIDVRYMFYGCYVRLCPKPIINCTGTFSTYGMLYRVSGLPTEVELFTGVKTNPTDIQSMYRQEFEWYNIDCTVRNDSTLSLYACENSFPWNGYTVDIDYGDGNIITIEQDIPDQATLTTLTSKLVTAGDKTIRVKAPFIVSIGNSNLADYKKLYGVLGKMTRNAHTTMSNTDYVNSSGFIIEGADFYKRNTHVNNIYMCWGKTNIMRIGTDVFKHLTSCRDISYFLQDTPMFNIEDGYKPNFDHMPLANIHSAFKNSGIVIDHDYEPFKVHTTITSAWSVFENTKIKNTPYIGTASLLEIQACYQNCTELEETYADLLDGATKCFNYVTMFKNTPKLKTIVGQTDSKALLDTAMTGVTRDTVTYREMFWGSGLNQQQIAQITNNLGIWKTSGAKNVTCIDMFRNCPGNEATVKTAIKFSTADKTIDATRMFYNCRIMNVPNNAITITNSGDLVYPRMFYNCFAAPEVEVLNDVFNIVNHPDTQDYRPSELNTLNVFRINVTPGAYDPSKMRWWINDSSEEYVYDDIVPKELMGISISKDIIVDSIQGQFVTTINMSKDILVVDIEEVK